MLALNKVRRKYTLAYFEKKMAEEKSLEAQKQLASKFQKMVFVKNHNKTFLFSFIKSLSASNSLHFEIFLEVLFIVNQTLKNKFLVHIKDNRNKVSKKAMVKKMLTLEAIDLLKKIQHKFAFDIFMKNLLFFNVSNFPLL